MRWSRPQPAFENNLQCNLVGASLLFPAAKVYLSTIKSFFRDSFFIYAVSRGEQVAECIRHAVCKKMAIPTCEFYQLKNYQKEEVS